MAEKANKTEWMGSYIPGHIRIIFPEEKTREHTRARQIKGKNIDGKVMYIWDEAETEILIAMRKKGFLSHQIADELNVDTRAVQNRIRTLIRKGVIKKLQ